MTASDFSSITADGRLCDAGGQLGTLEFETVMRKQARRRERESGRRMQGGRQRRQDCKKARGRDAVIERLE
jgi:hypothetical protein